MRKPLRLLVAVFACLALLLASSPPAVGDERGDVVTVSIRGHYMYAYESEVLRGINAQRAAAGLKALVLDADLMAAAETRAKEISVFFGHTRPNGANSTSISAKAYGENIAGGYATPAAVMTAWMGSSGHRYNILYPNYGSVGIGCFVSNGCYLWVQLFGYASTAPASVPSSNQTQDSVQEVTAVRSYLSISPITSLPPSALGVGDSLQVQMVLSNLGWDNLRTAQLDGVSFAWRSSNPAVARIDEWGTLTANKSGATTVTGALKADPSFAQSISVVVPSYALTVVGGKGDGRYAKGEQVPVSADPPSPGRMFQKWTATAGWIADAGKPNTVFTMPAKDATLTANFTCPVTSIEVAQTKIYMNVGSTTLRAVPVTKDGSPATLAWSSSAPQIVSVDKNGKVQALKSGKAVVTARAENGKSASFTVVVGLGWPTKTLAVKNPPPKSAMSVGSTRKLTVAFTPNDAMGVISFKSNNPNVLSVDSVGRLRALAKGVATITVAMSYKKVTLKITVK